jgi:predicted nucleic acid-binding protein
LAEALPASVLLIDDQTGRSIALGRNLALSGTLGVLEREDRMGLLKDFPRVLRELRTSGFFIASTLEQKLLERHRMRQKELPVAMRSGAPL